MSPVPAVTRDRPSDRTVPVTPYPTADVIIGMAKEIVVDWQMPAELERKN